MKLTDSLQIKKKLTCGLTGFFLSVFVVYAQIPPYGTAEKQVRNKIVPYFESYRSKLANINSSGIRNVEVDTIAQQIGRAHV